MTHKSNFLFRQTHFKPVEAERRQLRWNLVGVWRNSSLISRNNGNLPNAQGYILFHWSWGLPEAQVGPTDCVSKRVACKRLLKNVRHRQKVRRKERPRRIRIEPICSEAREGSLWSCRRFSIRLPWIERASQPSLPFIFSANCRRPSFFSLLQSLLFVVARSGFLLTICLSIYLSISECFLISVCTHEFSLSFSLFDGLPDALFIV